MELYPHCSVFTFQGTPVPTFQLGPRTLPAIFERACDELCCGMCAVLCGLLAHQWCRRHALQRSPTRLALTGRRLLGKVHTGRQRAVRLLCGGAVQRSWWGVCGSLLCYAHDTAFRTGLQVLLDHNILCFSAENSSFSPVRAQHIVVAKKNSYFSQKTVRNNRYFLACFCAICT